LKFCLIGSVLIIHLDFENIDFIFPIDKIRFNIIL